MKRILFFLAMTVAVGAFGQAPDCPHIPRLVVYNSAGDTIANGGYDTLQCGVNCVTMHATIDSNDIMGTTTYSVGSVSYLPFPYTGTLATFGGVPWSGTTDDSYGDLIHLPFSFCFFGNSYTTIAIGTNGNITFNGGLANAADPYDVTGPLPGTNCTATKNCIMSPWNDTYVGGGNIYYAVYGTAPCRQFVVSYDSVDLFEPGLFCDGNRTKSQIVLYETSNIIDVYIGKRTPCFDWIDGLAVTGIENNAGSLFYCPPGENGTAFTAVDEGWRFSPSTPINWTYNWKDSTGATIATADSIVICPLVNKSHYSVTASDPASCEILSSAFTLIKENGIGIDSTAFKNPSSCVAYDGYILFHGMPPGDTIFLTYAFNGVTTSTIVKYPDLDSNIIFSGLGSGTYTDFMFKHDSCTFGPFDFTLVAPPIHISNETSVNPSICGECNGSFTLYGLLPSQPVSLTYAKDGTVQPLYTGTTGSDSTVTISGLCAGTYTDTVNIGSCSANGTPITITNPAPVPATFTYTTQLHCNGDEIDLINTSTPGGYSAYWNFGDGSAVDSSNAIPLAHIFPDGATDVGTYVVQLTYQSYHNVLCISTVNVTVSFDHPISAAFTANANAVCQGTDIQFAADAGLTHNPTYSWNFGNGNVTPFSASNTADYTYPAGGHFTTTLTVADSLGCDTTATDTFDVITVDVHLTHDTSVCLMDSMALRAIAHTDLPFVVVNYAWSPFNNIGQDSSVATNFMGIGTFTYTVLAYTDPLGCTASDAETIVSYPPVSLATVTASPQTIPFGGSVNLNASGAIYYSWTPDNGTLSNANINDPVATPVDTTTLYTVYGMNAYGCKDSAYVVVNLDYNMNQSMPTGFSPNGDGLNDVFKITNLKYQKLVEFRIFNRWGQEVFYTSNPEVGWDGTFHGVPQDIDTYDYEIIVAMPQGINKVYKGTVTLVR